MGKEAIILGVPVGSDDVDVEDTSVETIQKYTPFFERLQHEAMPGVIAGQLLRKCGVPCVGYLARTVAPHRTRLATSIFDRWVEESYKNKNGFNHRISSCCRQDFRHRNPQSKLNQ